MGDTAGPGTGGLGYIDHPSWIKTADVQDARGYGYLTAARTLYLYALYQDQTGTANTTVWGRFLYRYVDLPLLEVVGMLSNTQAPLGFEPS